MISFNSNKSVGVVLQVQEDYLRVIDDLGEVRNIKTSDINKKFERDSKVSAQDQVGNTVSIENVIKCVDGKYKGKKGVIKHIYKTTLFLWDREFS